MSFIAKLLACTVAVFIFAAILEPRMTLGNEMVFTIAVLAWIITCIAALHALVSDRHGLGRSLVFAALSVTALGVLSEHVREAWGHDPREIVIFMGYAYVVPATMAYKYLFFWHDTS